MLDVEPAACDRVDARELICQHTARICTRAQAKRLCAVLLGGSLARDEATFIQGATEVTLIGDADFFLVYRTKQCIPSPYELASLAGEIERSLLGRGMRAEVGLGAITRARLERLQPSVEAYELCTTGRVVWGDERILTRIPSFAPADIPLEDGWRLLANRIIEHLRSAANGTSSPAFRYGSIKLVLDMATSFLVFVGHYRPSYAERADVLDALAARAQNVSAPFDLQRFARTVRTCTASKLGTAGTRPSSDPSWSEIAVFARRLWRWELQRLLGAWTEWTTDDVLMRRWMSQQTAADWIHGWASLCRRAGWLQALRRWPRWIRLALHGSPRYLTYSAAADVYFRLPALSHGESAERLSRASLQRLPCPAFSVNRGSGNPLLSVAAEVARHYDEYLKGSRT